MSLTGTNFGGCPGRVSFAVIVFMALSYDCRADFLRCRWLGMWRGITEYICQSYQLESLKKLNPLWYLLLRGGSTWFTLL